IIGCAGGPVVKVFLPIAREAVPADVSTLRISVRGLLGGHSGEDIHRCRANSIKLLCRLLYTLKESVALSLVDFMGGLK
ncbi:cytosol nonspecific dipeptidase, partial [Escherichia coli]|nr:cytosol nonspecific dipeptidase [Escherichia coli]